MRPTIFVAPLFDRYSGYGSKGDRMQGIRGSYADLLGEYGVRGFDSHDFFEGRFFVGFLEVFAVVKEQVNFFSFLDSDERKVFRKASCCLVSSGML